MNDLNARDAKLVQYLNEAYGKEKQLETALAAHIQLTTRQPYKRRLQQHLSETKDHGRQVERRIKQLGGSAETISAPGPLGDAAQAGLDVAQRAMAMAKGPLHAVRGTGEQEKMLKNAKTEYSEEAEEIATYTSIESLANVVGDRDTAKLARDIRRQEERMAQFLSRLIPQLTTAVAKEEIPSQLRNGARRSTRRSSPARSARARSSSASSGRASSGRAKAKRSTARAGSTGSSGTRRTASQRSASPRSTSSRGRASGSRSGSSKSGRGGSGSS
jgi:ferritin-like metal-binding protein YciE